MGNVSSSVDQVTSRRIAVPKRSRLGKARVFIAWSEETKEAACLIHKHLDDEHLSPWLSDQIESGAPFRTRIREAILAADLVIALFPKDPSRCHIAEAGLAYFEQKLLPVTIDTGQDKSEVVEPFGELQAQKPLAIRHRSRVWRVHQGSRRVGEGEAWRGRRSECVRTNT